MKSFKLFSRKVKDQKLEFMQRLCLRSFWVLVFSVVFGLSAEFVLQWFNRGSITAIVEIVLGVISFLTVFINGGYVTQNICRNLSLNRHGLRIPDDGSGKYYLPLPENFKIYDTTNNKEEDKY